MSASVRYAGVFLLLAATTGQGAAAPVLSPVLREFPAGEGRSIRVAVAPCDKGECPIEIALVRQNQILSSLRAPLAGPTDKLSLQHVSRGQGAGDPLDAPDLEGWISGNDERAITTTLRPLQFKGGIAAVLVTQFGGVQPARRVHAVYAARGDEIVRAWEGREDRDEIVKAASTAAPNPDVAKTYSATVTSPNRPADSVIFFRGFVSRDDAKPDALEALTFRWDPPSGRMRQGPARGQVFVFSLGDFPSPKQARAALAAAPDCLSDYWILPANPPTGRPTFRLTMLTTRKDLMTSLAKSVRQCAPQLRQRITRLP